MVEEKRVISRVERKISIPSNIGQLRPSLRRQVLRNIAEQAERRGARIVGSRLDIVKRAGGKRPGGVIPGVIRKTTPEGTVLAEGLRVGKPKTRRELIALRLQGQGISSQRAEILSRKATRQPVIVVRTKRGSTAFTQDEFQKRFSQEQRNRILTTLRKQQTKKDVVIQTPKGATRFTRGEFERRFVREQQIRIGAVLEKQELLKEGRLPIKRGRIRRALDILTRFSRGFLEFPRSLIRGLANIARSGSNAADSIIKSSPAINKLAILTTTVSRLRKQKRPLTQVQINKVNNQLKSFKSEKKRLKKAIISNKQASELINSQEVKLVNIIAGLTLVGIAGAAAPAIVNRITNIGLSTVGVIVTGRQAVDTFKKPTPENFGRLAFYALPTAIAIFKTAKKLSPNFRPTVKNARTMRNKLIQINRENDILLRQVRRAKNRQAINLVLRRKKSLTQALKELKIIIKDPRVLKAREFNPIVHNRAFKKLQGSYREGIHVSTEPKANKLFGREVQVRLGRRAIFRRILEKAGRVEPSKKLGRLSTKTKFDKLVINTFKRRNVILSGGKALNIQVKLLRRRFTQDIDGIVGRGAKNILTELAKKGNKLANANRFIVKRSGFKDTFKLIDKLSKKILVEITNVSKLGKLKFVTNPQGIKVLDKISLLFKKADSISKPGRFARKGKLDIGDIRRLAGKRIKVRDLLPRRRNPSNVFEVVRKLKGMGKDRIAFDETHMFFDFEAPIGYSKGRPYSIIRFPRVRISRFPKNLRIQVTKAANGQLSVAQGIALRKALNRHIKLNPNKFFLAPRTSSMPIGEREIVLAETSKFIKGNIYKTFDNDLQKFVSVIEAGFNKPVKLSLARRFIVAWRKNPFLQLKLRLTNPDLLRVRRFSHLLERDLGFLRKDKLSFVQIFKKLIKSKKALKAITPISPKERLRIPRVPIKEPGLAKLREIVKGSDVAVFKSIPSKFVRGRRVTPTEVRVARRIARKLPRARPFKKVAVRVRVAKPKREIGVPVIPARIPEIRALLRDPIFVRRVIDLTRLREPRIPIRPSPRVPTRAPPIRPPRITVPPARPPRIPPRRPPEIVVPPIPPPLVPPERRRKQIKRLKKIIDKFAIRQKFIYIPDLFSSIFGITANQAEKRAFLRKGRVFSGAEIRKIVI